MPTHTTLKGVAHVGSPLLSDNLEANLYSFFNWGLLGAGGFSNVTLASSGAYGSDAARLRLVEEPNYEEGQVWEGFRQDWVWETGVEYGYQPTRVSGVYVDGTFRSISGTGAYAHKVNYPLGRVVFDSAISPSSVVRCEYSYRHFHWTTADCLWWRQLQYHSYRVDDNQFLQQGSGVWDILAQNRVQLPAVVVEVPPRSMRYGKQLGGGTIVKQEAHFHILAETPWDRKQLHDVITGQQDKRLIGFDKNLVSDANKFPLDADGMPTGSGACMYPDLVKPTGEGGCAWETIRLIQAEGVPIPGPVLGGLYGATVRVVCELDQP